MAQAEMLILSYLGEPFSVALEERPGGHGLQPPPAGGEDESPQGGDEEGVGNRRYGEAEHPQITSLGCSTTREADDECHENDPEQRVVDQNQDEHVPLLTTGQARTIIVIIA